MRDDLRIPSFSNRAPPYYPRTWARRTCRGRSACVRFGDHIVQRRRLRHDLASEPDAEPAVRTAGAGVHDCEARRRKALRLAIKPLPRKLIQRKAGSFRTAIAADPAQLLRLCLEHQQAGTQDSARGSGEVEPVALLVPHPGASAECCRESSHVGVVVRVDLLYHAQKALSACHINALSVG